ncbi:conserved hypothetical protein [Chthoniobacter flavus Ellin428]|uniref:MORN variant repeat protein n=1 Tax=Chthoniobacter flavus Ellin428 TaxID=497964 RepID=B4DC48_9BACT|nr:hypothetical protein [Chthoniobacter flavus]EDY15970.1 conserved hypothetical protein [Chthoniobacter flavus Ellin428]TCO83284.1 MORN repeat protein [Chthoniobacter flavus]
MKTTAILSLCALLFCVEARAQEASYLDYAIPPDAKKIQLNLPRNLTGINYFLPNSETLIGKERYTDQGILVSREMFLHGEKHGVQREWYPNGQLKSEEPYRNGVRHGVFKTWSENGALIGQSSIVEGTGKLEVYDVDGVFTKERNYKGNRQNGLFVDRLNYPGNPDHRMTLMWFKNGESVGNAFDFYEDGTLSRLNFRAPWHSVIGPSIDFDRRGGIESINWYRSGQEVTEAEYAKAAALDPKLPPYYHEPDKYKEEFVTPEVRALVEHYQKMPPVKIPLEFGPDGKPILARQP